MHSPDRWSPTAPLIADARLRKANSTAPACQCSTSLKGRGSTSPPAGAAAGAIVDGLRLTDVGQFLLASEIADDSIDRRAPANLGLHWLGGMNEVPASAMWRICNGIEGEAPRAHLQPVLCDPLPAVAPAFSVGPADLCHPVPSPAPFTRDGCIFELKQDGFRALAVKDETPVQLLSRSLIGYSSRSTSERHGEALFREIAPHDQEGMVAKRLDARYLAGRQPTWLKIKNRAYSRRGAIEWQG